MGYLQAKQRARTCPHAAAREIRVYASYAFAFFHRNRVAFVARDDGLAVSNVYPIDGGWAWTICEECRGSANGTAPE